MIYQDQGKRIMNKLQQLIYDEFKVAVFFDKNYAFHGTTFFNIYQDSISNVQELAGGLLKEYLFRIRYYMTREGYARHTHHEYMSNATERLMRLFKNCPAPIFDETTFSTYLTRFAYSVDYWNLITKYIYHSGMIDAVDYDPSRTPGEERKNLHIVEYTFRCHSSEPDYE